MKVHMNESLEMEVFINMWMRVY